MPKFCPNSSTEKQRLKRMLAFERKAKKQGFKSVSGVDEAGRGPLAGPLVAAACILPPGVLFHSVDDCKKLTPGLRDTLYTTLTEHPEVYFGVGVVDHALIDAINIYQATIQAMLQAIGALPKVPDLVLADAMQLPHLQIPCWKIIHGDQLSLSIAAASIIAKVTRDRLMDGYHEKWPQYGFKKHKGYGTPEHLKALEEMGPCPIHRTSFEPVKSQNY
jgi:ribonuclease HII